jgi:DNA-nicking Smr family endonuclease
MPHKSDHLFWIALNRNAKRLSSDKVPLRQPQPTLPQRKVILQKIAVESRDERFIKAVTGQIAPKKSKSFGVEFIQSRKMKNVKIEACVDLHGQTQTKSSSVVHSFLYHNYLADKLWVKIITGKSGILFNLAPQLLEECAAFVSGYAYAPQNDGGTGALYVRIRKK